LVLHCVVLMRGLHSDDIKAFLLVNVSGDPWPFVRGLVHVVGIASSYVSLVITLMYYNGERVPGYGQDASATPQERTKFCAGLLLTLTCVLFRVFLSAVLFSVAPLAAALAALAAFILSLGVSTAALGCGASPGGVGGVTGALVSAYASLFTPSGHARGSGSAPATSDQNGE